MKWFIVETYGHTTSRAGRCLLYRVEAANKSAALQKARRELPGHLVDVTLAYEKPHVRDLPSYAATLAEEERHIRAAEDLILKQAERILRARARGR